METTTLQRQEPQTVAAKREERRPTFSPYTDIVETTDSVLLVTDMPGVDPDSVELTVQKGILTLEGRPHTVARDGFRLVHCEHVDGGFQRTFRLSDEVDVTRIEATVRDGVLRVTLPKVEAARSRKIQVTAR